MFVFRICNTKDWLKAAKARGIYDRQAKERLKESGEKFGRGQEKGRETLPYPIPDKGRSRDQAGKALNVSGR
jgi:hypothetical protein